MRKTRSVRRILKTAANGPPKKALAARTPYGPLAALFGPLSIVPTAARVWQAANSSKVPVHELKRVENF